MLATPVSGECFVLYCDTSLKGLGCVPIQNDKIIVYASMLLKIHEQNYPTHDLELASIIFALKIWRHYLYGEQLDVYSYHKSLKYIFAQKEINLRQGRWMEFLKHIDFTLYHHPGKVNVVVDALSRKALGSLSYL